MLDIVNLRASRGGADILRGATLTAEAGEVTALLGLNGSGKSTLLLAALGLIPSTYDRCAVNGESLPSATARRRAQLAAYIPQRVQADNGLTALEVALMGANARTPLLSGYGAADRRLAMQCLERLGIGALADRTMGTLSEGQKKLAVLARALAQRSGALLLDEPDGALDLPRRYEMMAALRELAREEKCAALVTLHDAALALSAADRVLVLCGGEIVRRLDMRAAQQGEIEEAMRVLYGEVRVFGKSRAWGVAPAAGPPPIPNKHER